MADFNALVEGYRRFRETGWSRERDRWAELAEGQSPKVMVIACSDSRVDPAQIFDASPGEMFVVRNVAALVPPYETTPGRHGVSAALEFAVTQLQVEEVIVMGHGFCGGCAAALTGQFDEAQHGEGHFIADWIEMLRGARDDVRARLGRADYDRAAFREMELEAVRVSLANLRTFPWVRDREAEGRLTLRGTFFSISEGVLHVLGETGAFAPA
ncbi:MAG TPA: carbonic anhydrase [Allosphingosinicella sp.]|jgi:carbonic anhydrase